MPNDARFVQRVSASIVAPYRGGVAENARRFKLPGSAYKSLHDNFPEQRGSFWIESARHLAGPLAALADPAVRRVHTIGATQVLKSVQGDVWIPFIAEHTPGDTLILFETDPKAQLFSEKRLGPTLKEHPVLKDRFKAIQESDRHGVTRTKLKLPGMIIDIGGLNDSNVSTFSYQYVWISEGWQAKSNGMLRKGFKRTDRFPDNCKVLNESQAGMAGEDLHTECKTAHQVPLTWDCPYCIGRQTWEFSRLRPEDFAGLGSNPPKPNTWAGMWFEPEETILPDGRIITRTIDERARSARWECYHCGERIQDTRDIRRKIMDSYQQDYKITLPSGERISPKEVCFIIPFEAALGNSFENSAKSYLKAKDSEANGNQEDIKSWHMAERAEFWEPRMGRREVVQSIGSYDPNQIVENEHHRGMIVDSQKHKELDTVGTFWCECYVADKFGNSWQLEREFCESWERLRELQKKWKIPNHYVCIDGRKWTPMILQKVAEFAELQKVMQFGRPAVVYSTWKVLLGDDARQFPWPDKKQRVWSFPTCRNETIYRDGARLVVPVWMYRWSNPSIKDQLNDLIIGGEGKPKFLWLNRSQISPKQQAKERDDLTQDKQMTSEVRVEKPNGKIIWEKIGNRPNHFWDTSCMRLTRMAMNGIIGHAAAPPPE